MAFEIRNITAKEALPIRHRVLWPDKPIAYSVIEDDATGWHLGVFAREELICVASVFIDGPVARLRKFATLPTYQSRGAGSAVIARIVADLEARGIRKFWCDARLSATGFYERFGMKPEGEVFFKEDTPYVKMAIEFATA